MKAARAGLVLAAFIPTCGTCSRHESASPSSSTTITAKGSAQTSQRGAPVKHSPAPNQMHEPGRPPGPNQTSKPVHCRALTLRGDVHDEHGRAVRAGEPLASDEFLELSTGASLTVKHSDSSREYRIVGPGEAEPCWEGREQVVMTRGKFEAEPGFGVRPGAQVRVATPSGVVSYADGDLILVVEPRSTSVEVRAGQVELTPAHGGRLTGQQRPAGPRGRGRLVLPPAVSAEQLVVGCEAAADVSSRKALAILDQSPADGGDLGELARAHVEARETARNACLAAQAAVQALVPPGNRGKLAARLAAANRRWQRLPLH